MRSLTVMAASLILVSATVCLAQNDDALTVAAKQVADRFVQSADAKRGEVAEVDATTIYVLLGLKDGVQEGNALNVVSKGDPIVVAGETVGFKEKPVGTAEITRVQSERLSVATMKTTLPGQQVQKGCLAYIKPVPSTLAVSTFLRQDSAATLMGQEFADKLGVALQATGRFQMVERTRLESALAEDKLGLNDLFDPAKTAPLGKKLQAKGVVLGTITQQFDRYTVSVRVVDIASGTVVCTATTSCGKNDELDRKYAEVVSAGGGGGGTGKEGVGGGTGQPAVTKSLFDEDLQWLGEMKPNWATLDDCSIAGQAMLGARWFGRFSGLDGHGQYSVYLDRKWRSLTGMVGLKDTSYMDCVTVTLLGDGRTIGQLSVRRGRVPMPMSVDLSGVETLTFKTSQEGQQLRWSRDCVLSSEPTKAGPP